MLERNEPQSNALLRTTLRYLAFKSLGYAVVLQHSFPFNDKPTWSLYLHLDQPPRVDPGDQVKAGQTVLGYIGQTGAAFGLHTHLEVRHFPDRVSPNWRNIYGVEAPAEQGGTFDAVRFLTDWVDPQQFLHASAVVASAANPVKTGATPSKQDTPHASAPAAFADLVVLNQTTGPIQIFLDNNEGPITLGFFGIHRGRLEVGSTHVLRAITTRRTLQIQFTVPDQKIKLRVNESKISF